MKDVMLFGAGHEGTKKQVPTTSTANQYHRPQALI